jgi:hypothetical protein
MKRAIKKLSRNWKRKQKFKDERMKKKTEKETGYKDTNSWEFKKEKTRRAKSTCKEQRGQPILSDNYFCLLTIYQAHQNRTHCTF